LASEIGQGSWKIGGGRLGPGVFWLWRRSGFVALQYECASCQGQSRRLPGQFGSKQKMWVFRAGQNMANKQTTQTNQANQTRWKLTNRRDYPYREIPLWEVRIKLPKSSETETVQVFGAKSSSEAMTLAVEVVCDRHGLKKPAFLAIVSLNEVMVVSPVRE
jgi:hypothetical protein